MNLFNVNYSNWKFSNYRQYFDPFEIQVVSFPIPILNSPLNFEDECKSSNRAFYITYILRVPRILYFLFEVVIEKANLGLPFAAWILKCRGIENCKRQNKHSPHLQENKQNIHTYKQYALKLVDHRYFFLFIHYFITGIGEWISKRGTTHQNKAFKSVLVQTPKLKKASVFFRKSSRFFRSISCVVPAFFRNDSVNWNKWPANRGATG